MSQESTPVVYVTIAVLMFGFALVIMFAPFDLLSSGHKTRAFVAAITSAVGETGTRLMFAGPCALLAYVAARLAKRGSK